MKTMKRLFITVFAALVLLSGCWNDPFAPPSMPPPNGTGSLILRLNGYEPARTIVPQDEDYDFDLDNIVMTFTPTAPAGDSFDITWINDTTPIELPVGTYDLVVSAYNIWMDDEPAAMSESQPVTIGSGVTTATVTLSLIVADGEGLFGWDIDWGGINVKSASIFIIDINTGNPADDSPIDVFENGTSDPTLFCTLPVGFYRVTFELVNDEGQKAIRKEILHIYKNMESHFKWEVIAQNFFDAPGTADNPFIVYDEETLRKVGSGDDGWTMSAHYEQIATISLTDAWTPIGSDRFTGSYDGGGYTIQNMTISADSADVGLFASIEGTVKNVNLTGVDITNGTSQGGVAGTNFGTVQYCYSTGNVTGDGDNTGGIAGESHDTIEYCYSTGKVTSTGNNVGGIAGASLSLGTLQNCYSTGDVSGNWYVGGIVGTFSGTSLARCYATGNVTGAQNMVGGIVGSTIAAPISSCVALNPTITSGQPVSIGRVAGNATGTMGNLYGRKDMLVNGTVLTTGIGPNTINGGDVSTATPSYHDQSFWEQTEGFVFGPTTGPWEWNSDTNLPILRAFPTAAQNHTVKPLPGEISGNGVVGDPFIINDAAGLQLIGTLGYPLTANTYYKLGADIDMTGVTWTPIGTGTGANSFNGTFDGAGHTIDNFTGVSGLFGYIGANGTVKNLGMVDVNINNTASGVTGGLTANNSGTIENCFVSGTVSSTVLGADVGGVVGSLLGGTVRNCYSTADVTSDRRAGGIVGNVSSNTAVIEYCYSTGRVTSTSSNNAAGIVGYTGTTTGTGGGTVQRCVALNASVSGGGNSGRVANMTTDMLSRNYGRNPMTLTGGTLTGATATGKDGANVTVAQSGTQTWWSNTGPLFVFDPAGPWVWNDTTNLPILKGFASGTQNPTVKQPLPGGTPEMVRIKAGTSFMMGSPPSEPGSFDNETQHSVTLTQGFYMGIYPVTQAQYQAVMGTNPSNFKTGVTPGEVQGKRPVEQVSWYETLVFCNKLSVIEGLTPAYSISGSTNPDDWGNVPTASDVTWDAVSIVVGSTGYRLPTEAQWEYACRAGTTTAYYTGDTENDALKDAAWYIDNAGDKTHEVGLKTPNTWGLYDMMGNVVEWCWDWYDNNYGSTAGVAQIDPQGAVSGANRVRRGGSWCYYGEYLRSACRGYYDPDDQVSNHGFRLVRPWQN